MTCAACVGAWPAGAIAADTDNSSPVRNNFGGVGMIDMPSARMAPDGELAVGASFFENTQHYNIAFQALPWLEGSFRYSGLKNFEPYFSIYYDRAFALKARIWQEGDILPSVAIGINDLVGTGVYDGEYVVASKTLGPVEATLGMGWGRLATANNFRNPLSLISSSFASRVNDTSGVGQFPIKTYFRGPKAGVFGGLVWHTPVPELSLIAELSSDNYQSETIRGNFSPRNQFNFGIFYQAFDSTAIGVNWMYGRAVGFNLSFQTDPTRDAQQSRIQPALPEVRVRTAEEQRAALQRLVDEHNGTFASRRGNSSNLVDALWRGVPNVTNVSLNGRSLLISSAGPPASCDTVARLVSALGDAIDNVSVAGGGRVQRCHAIEAVARLSPALLTDAVGGTVFDGMVVNSQPLVTINASSGLSDRDATALIKADMAKQQIVLEAISLSSTEALVYYSNSRYFHEREAVDRIARVLMHDAPAEIEKFRIVSTMGGRAQSQFTVLRSPTERQIEQTGDYSLLADGNQMTPASLNQPVLAQAERKTFPRFSWSIFPQFRQQLFDPSNPFAVQFVAGTAASLALTPNLSVNGEVEFNLYDNFNVNRSSDSLLPHVRTDYVRFFTEGKNGIGSLDAEYNFRAAPTVYGVVKAGYLESMYAGVGGEVLWRPEGQRWAIGADLYEVQERAFNRLYGLQPYRVTTGHVSLYYASPWYGIDFALRAGRYLAGDKGATLELSRRFDTGVEIGVFATKTNVSASRFGEGSFDKGFFIRIPLNWALPIPTQREFGIALRPVQRDGGQRLEGDTTLYETTRRASEAAVRLDENSR